MSSGASASIAIVDDDDSLRHSLVRLFRSAGYSVEAFASATEFLSSLSVGRPDCVILDLQLPGMTGVELLRRFAVLADPPPAVVITGNDDECLRHDCIALGARRYFRKPLDSDALLDAVPEIVERSARDAVGL
jgi:two-component system, LuxR family, response regulator FixJ